MSDVEKYIAERKKTDPEFAEGFEQGYKEFEFGVLLRQAREDADRIPTKKENRRR